LRSAVRRGCAPVAPAAGPFRVTAGAPARLAAPCPGAIGSGSGSLAAHVVADADVRGTEVTDTATRARSLGLAMTTALVVGNMVGSGDYLLPSSLAKYGGLSILGWVVTALGAVLLALVFARLGRVYPQTGGPYTFTRRAFGEFIGFQTAWGYWIATWTSNAALAIGFVSYLDDFWTTLAADKLLAALVAIAAIWVLTWINAIGVRAGGITQVVTTVIKLIPLLFIAVVGLAFVHADHFRPFNASGESGLDAVTAAATLTLFAFVGLESATVAAGDVRDPERTIPRATVIGTLTAAVVFILGQVAVLGVIPASELAKSTAPFADAAEAMLGSWAGTVVAVSAVIGTFGALNGWILLQGQVPLAAARDGLFPPVFARVSRSGTPVHGLVISSALMTVLIMMNYTASLVDQFTQIILLATLSILVPYTYTAAAQLMLMVTDRDRFSGGRLVRDGGIAILAFAYTLWAIAGAGADIVLKGFLLLLAGIPVYVWIRRRHLPGPTPAAIADAEPEPVPTAPVPVAGA
jgi:basic amino acid/polyamine antiporter, APA family